MKPPVSRHAHSLSRRWMKTRNKKIVKRDRQKEKNRKNRDSRRKVEKEKPEIEGREITPDNPQ